MKRLLLFSTFLLGLITAGKEAFAGTPAFTYTAAASYTLGTAMTLSPTVTTPPTPLVYTTPGTAFGTATNFNEPWAIAMNASATDVFICNETGGGAGTGSILEYTTAGVYVGTVVSGLTGPTSIAFDAAGNMYVGLGGGGTGGVLKYNSSYVAQTLTLSNAPVSIYGLTVDASGNIYVADENGGAIYEYNSSGTLLLTITGGNLSGPVDVQVDNSGNIYDLDYTNRDIVEFNSAGTYVALIVAKNTFAKYPYSFYRDASGNFYVDNTDSQSGVAGVVDVYTSTGTAITNFNPTNRDYNFGIVAGPSGTLYVSDAALNTVYKYACTGGYFISSGTLPAGTAFNSTTGVISGTPTVAGSYPITVTGYGTTGNVSSSFTILVISKPIITYPTPDTYVINTAITALTPTNTGSPVSGTGTYIYAISAGTLPTGLSLTAATGVISGTPTVAGGPTSVSITATNSYGTSTAFAISITVISPPAIAYATPDTYTVGTAITTLSPTNTGGAVTATKSYSTTGTIVLNAATNSLNEPYGMGVDPSGNVYVVNYGANTVTEYSTTGTVTTYGTGVPTGPIGITFDSSGNAYVVGKTSETVVKFTGGMSGTPSLLLTGTSAPTAIAMDGTNNLFVANFAGANTVTKYTTSGTLELTINSNGALFPFSAGMYVDASDNVWVADNDGGSYVDEYSSTGAYVTELTLGSTNSAIYIDGANNDYLTTTTGKYVAAYTPTWAAAVQTITPPFSSPRGVVTNPSGDLFVSDYTANTVTEFVPTSGYFLSGVLPPGLAFSSTTGQITGTPTLAYSGSYTVTAYNAAGHATSNTFTITCGSKPIITYPTPDSYLRGAAITALTPTNTGSPVSGTGSYIYAVSAGTLPTGLSLNPATGVITGTPTVAGGPTSVSITATNSYGTSTAFAISITVTAPPAITYTTPNTYTVGTAITTLSPTNSGGAVAATRSYSTTGTIVLNAATNSLNEPYGMGVDPSGNVYVVNYGANTVTEYSTTGTATTYGTGIPSGPIGITFDSSGNAYVVGNTSKTVVKFTGGMSGTSSLLLTGTSAPTAISMDGTNNLFVANFAGANTITKYTTSGTLELTINSNGAAYPFSAGMYVDASDNVWVADNDAGSYVDEYSSTGAYVQELARGSGNSAIYIDGANDDYLTTTTGDYVAAYTPTWAAATQTITPPFSSARGVVTNPAGDLFVSDYTANTVTEFTPTSGYFLSGILPPGLAFSNTTGQITGTPTLAYSGTYTVWAYNASGAGISTSNSFTITCGSKPIITYPTPDSYLLGAAITALTPTNTGSPVSGTGSYIYAVSAGTLPTGLSLNPATGVITGTPTVAGGPTSVSITATNSYGTSTAFAISITVTAPPAITYTTPNTYTVGTAITTLSPTNSGGAVAATRSYSTTGTIVLNAATNSLNEPYGMGVDPSGNVYVVNFGANTVTEYSTTGTVTTYGTGIPTGPIGITFDSSGNAYVVGNTSKTVVKFTGGMSGTSSLLLTGTSAPTAIAMDATNNLFVANFAGANTVTKYTTSGTLELTINSNGAAYPFSAGMYVDASDNVWVADNDAGSYVDEYSSTGAYVQELARGSGNSAIYIDGANDDYLTTTTGDYVAAYTPTWAAATQTITPPFSSARGVVTSPAGDLFVSDYTANTVTEFTPTSGYFLSGVLPPGLSFSNTTGQITGTPTAAYSGTYTVWAYNASGLGISTSNTFTITCGSKPIISYTTPDSYAIGGPAITPLTPTNTGSPVSGTGTYVYAITAGTLPTGWTFTAATGVITGTPTTAYSGTLTITATNAYGTSTPFVITISIAMPAVLTYNTPNYYAVNTAITTLSPTNTGGAVTATQTYGAGTVILNTATNGLNEPVGMAVDASGNLYVTNFGANSVTEYSTTGTVTTYTTGIPAGPIGIVFDSSGNAYVLSRTSSTVTKFTGGISGAAAGIITGLSTPTGIAIDENNNLYVANSGNNTITKYTTAGGTPTLTLNPNTEFGVNVTGEISVDASGNIYFGYNSDVIVLNPTGTEGTAYAPITTGVAGIYVDGGGNVFLTGTTSKTGAIYTPNLAAETGTPYTGYAKPEGIVADGLGNFYISDYTNGTVTKYSPSGGYYLSGTLPPGLSFSNTTGAISGTPTGAYSGSYTVTGYNGAGGATSNTFVINCGYAPAITYTTPDDYLVNTAITTLTPSYTAGTVTGTWSVSPALPTGLSIDAATGIITGTPTVQSSATNYVVTTSNVYGNGSFAINITVYAAPLFTYSPNPDNIAQNVAMTALPPITSTGGGAPIPNTTTPYSTTGVSFKTGLTKPWGIASDANGNIYVTSYTGKTIVEYNSAGTALGTYTNAYDITGVTVDPYGNVYAICNNGYIYKYSATFGGGTLLTSAIYTYVYTEEGAAETSSGYGITCDAAGNLYVTDNWDGDIWKYTANTGVCSILVAYGVTGIDFPTGIAVDASGNVYIVDTGTAALVKYSSTGTYLSEPVAGLNTPYAVTIDALGNIFIGDSGTKTVKEYTSTGTLIQTIETTTLPNPRGITEDPSYNLYVSDYTNGTVTKYLPNFYTIVSGTLPTGVTFNQNTGTFSGTPTTTGTYTVNVLAYGMQGTSGSYSETFNCYTSYDWVGTTSTAWNVTTNWESHVVPTATSTADIGVNIAFTNQPIVSASTTVAAIQIGNTGGKAATLSVNTGITLTVTGNITKQSDANSLQAYATGSSLAGAGTIKAVNLDVIGSTTLGSAYTETFSSSVTSLQLSGTVSLTSGFSTYAENATFNLTGGVASVAGALTTSNAVGGTSTFGVVPTTTATLQLANTAALSGLSATGTNVTSFQNPGSTIEYSGAAQTVYTDLAVANLSNTVTYENIKFSGTGIKTPTAGNLTIPGNFTNAMPNTAGNYVALYNTPVNFTGASAQALAGGTASQSYGTVFNTVNFSNAGVKTMSGNFYVLPTGLLTMSSSAALVAGDNNTTPTTTDAYLTLISDADSTAAVAPIPSGCSITGNVNVQRYVSGDRSYRVMSSPVSATGSANGIGSMNYLLNSFYLTGPGSGYTATGNPTLFLYNESFVPQYSTFYNSNYIAVNSMSSGTGADPTYPVYTPNGAGLSGSYTVPAANGYYVFYRGNLSEGTTNLTNPAYTPVLGTVATTTGTLNQGQVNFAAWYAPSSTTFGGVSQYWYLVGNPYASSIDLATVQGTTTSSGIFMTPYNSGTNTGITSFVYELQPASGVYAIYNTAPGGVSTAKASEFIGSGQGFLIEAYGAGSSQLVFNESAKASATNANLPPLFMAKRINNRAGIITNSPNAILRLKMSLDTINNEETVITFNPKSSTGFVINEDARHWKSEGLVGFTSISSDNIPLAINSTPLAATQTIPLRVVATNDGLYNISLAQSAPLPALYEIWLKDAYMKDSLDIKDNPTYNFNILHADTNSFGDNRFSLVIRQNPALMVHLLSFTALKATGGDNVNWTTENEANYTHFAVQRSTNGGQTFATLDSLVSSGLGTYSYLDSKPIQGANSYRLQLTDLNGNITYSNVITIMYANTGNQIALNGFMVYPNPTVGAFNLSITQPAASSGTTASATVSTNYNIQIVNNLGVVLKTAQSSSPQWQTDVSALSPGTYFITVTNASTNTVVGKSAFVKL